MINRAKTGWVAEGEHGRALQGENLTTRHVRHGELQAVEGCLRYMIFSCQPWIDKGHARQRPSVLALSNPAGLSPINHDQDSYDATNTYFP